VIQGTSVTFAWVTGLAFLSAHIGENELGTYVGWTTVGVAVGEIIGPLIGGPIYEYVGHWATFGAVEAMLILDILCRVLIKEKKSDPESKTDGTGRSEHASEGSRLLPDCESNAGSYGAVPDACRTSSSSKSIAVNLAWNWLATVLNMVIIFAVRGALEVVSQKRLRLYEETWRSLADLNRSCPST
jgi:MFS family permease